jgi:hypothetical protein
MKLFSGHISPFHIAFEYQSKYSAVEFRFLTEFSFHFGIANDQNPQAIKVDIPSTIKLISKILYDKK